MPNGKDSIGIERTPYKIGYSFQQPEVLKPITFERRKPFFTMNWAGHGPADVQREFWESKKLNNFPSVWRRAAKTHTSDKIGYVRSEVPSFQELGAAPGPTTSSVTNKTERNVWGSLFNDLLKTGGEAFQVSQQTQLAKAQATAQRNMYGGMFPNVNLLPGGGGMGIFGWGLVAAGLGTIGYIVMRNR